MSDSSGPLIITESSQLQLFSNDCRARGKKIAFVPTMGGLHKGHLSLVSKAGELGDVSVVSIFVNPAQFDDSEDFKGYSRDITGDLEKLSDYKVDVVFTPDVTEIYSSGFQTYVEVTDLQDCMCGLHRPGHFRGVATVVLKLFNIVKPDYAIFGQKDYQQLKIIERMVKDLNLEVTIVSMPIVRDKDGLALSSRNKNLSTEQRKKAVMISKTLFSIRQSFLQGCTDASRLVEDGENFLANADIDKVDFLEVRDPENLALVKEAKSGDLIALAAKIGRTRLIDNLKL